jgi:type I restriction enzyme S subunit
MNAERLLAHYELIADAPDAIAKLRRFILDLAVRGKLVPQETNDEPASELLKRLAKEKARLFELGEERRPKPFPPVGNDERPFDEPQGWVWTRLASITLVTQGFAFSSGDYSKSEADGPPLIKIGDIGSNSPEVFIKGEFDPSYLVQPGDLLLGLSGSIKCSIWRGPVALLNQRIARIRPTSTDLRNDWLYLIVNESLGKWKAETSKLTVQNIKSQQLNEVPVPLPPLAEQHRIVAKVDELMALCDRLEAARAERETTRDRLTAASLARLNDPDHDPVTFAGHARFALGNLAALTTRPDQIKQLRQTILNLAVRGKLVPQDPNDEPVGLKPADCSDRPESIPSTWVYTRLSNLLAEDTRNGYSRKPDEAPDGIPILRISAGTVRRDGVVAEEEHKLISGVDQAARHQYGLMTGDLLACRFNGNKAFVGRLTIFKDYLGLQPIYPDKLIRVRVARNLLAPEFLRLAGDSDLVRVEIEAMCATTVGNWGISASNLREVRFPLPPLAEQHRIVAKVDELMALCDRLEASLTATAATRRRLLDALLAEALEPAVVQRIAAE